MAINIFKKVVMAPPAPPILPVPLAGLRAPPPTPSLGPHPTNGQVDALELIDILLGILSKDEGSIPIADTLDGSKGAHQGQN
ncbi:hypothetical protein RUND412_011199 [Rhizina undulata]